MAPVVKNLISVPFVPPLLPIKMDLSSAKLAQIFVHTLNVNSFLFEATLGILSR